MRSVSYLSSARTSSLVMLVAVGVGYQLSSTYARQASLLLEARNAFATHYVQSNPFDTSRSVDEAYVPGFGRVWISRMGGPGWERYSVIVQPADRRRWATVVSFSADSASEDHVAAVLRRIARELGLAESEKQSYVDVFDAIDKGWSNRDVMVPGLDLGLRPHVAPWIIAIGAIVLLVMMDNQLRTVLADSELALDEPWLVLDARRPLEKLVAGAWIMVIGLAPWLAGLSVVMMFASQLAAGSIPTLWGNFLAFVAALALLATGGWAAGSVLNSLFHLRRSRLSKLTEDDT